MNPLRNEEPASNVIGQQDQNLPWLSNLQQLGAEKMA